MRHESKDSKESKESKESKAGLLILHLDINKTLILVDPASGQSMDVVVNGCLANACFGTVDISSDPPTWERLTDEPTHFPPTRDSLRFTEFVDDYLHPESDSMDVAARRDNKMRRRSVWRHFTEPGQPGEHFRPHYERVLKAVTIDDDDWKKASEVLKGIAGLKNRRFILPSYFHMLATLAKQRRDFVIVFRTFGSDLGEVIEEHNLFCEGKHPLYPVPEDVDGERLKRLILRDTKSHMGRMSRGEGDAETILKLESGEEFSGLKAVHGYIHGEVAKGVRCLGIGDDYPWWYKCGEVGEAGKVLTVDRGDKSVHPIFFDDNIELDNPHIVDARDVLTGESITYEESKDVYLHMVRTVSATEDPEYYVKAIEAMEASRAKAL